MQQTGDAVIDAAIKVARRMGKKYGADPGEYLGAAWEGASRVADRPHLMEVAAVGEVYRERRRVRRWWRVGKPDFLVPITNAVVERAAARPDAEPVGAEAVFEAYRPVWMYWPEQVRRWVADHIVGGMTIKQIARQYGRPHNEVRKKIRSVLPHDDLLRTLSAQKARRKAVAV